MTPSSLFSLDRRANAQRVGTTGTRVHLVAAASGLVFLTALGLPGVALADQATPTTPVSPTPATPQTTPPTTPPPTPTAPTTPAQTDPTQTTPPAQQPTTTVTPTVPGGTNPAPSAPEVPQPSAKTPPTPLPTKPADTSIVGVKPDSIKPNLLFAGQVPGQPLPGDPTTVMSLDDAIKIGLQHSPSVIQAQETAYKTVKVVDQIRAIEKPQVTASASYARLANGSSAAISGGPTPSSIVNPFSVGLTTTPPGSTPIALSSSTTSSGSTVTATSGTSTSSGSTTTATSAVTTTAGGTSSTAAGTSTRDQTTRQTTGTGTTTTGTGTTTAGGGAASTTELSNPGVDLNNESARISVTQLIDITGIVRVAENYGRLQEAFSRLDLARVRQQTVYNIRNAYYNLLRALAFEYVDEAAVKDSAELLRVTQAQKDQGVAAQFDVLTAQTTLDNNNQALISARNQVALSKNAFANALGIDPSTMITPQAQPIPDLPDLDENNLLHSAFAQRPEYLEADINLLKAGASIRLSKRSLEPYLDAGVTAAYTPSNDSTGAHKTTASIGATLTVPLYDGGATAAAVEQAKSDQRVAYVQKDQFVKGIKAEVQQSIIAVRDANQRSAVVTATVTEAQEALRLANVRFKAGVGTQLDVNNAEAQLVQAESNQVNAQFDYLGALARLTLAVGTPQ